MAFRDPDKYKTYQKEYRANRWKTDPEYRASVTRRARINDKTAAERNRNLIAEFKAGGCKLCGETEPVALCAHHLNPDEKDYDVGALTSRRIGLKKVQAELAKCVCLCMNCHAKVHAGLICLLPQSQNKTPTAGKPE